MKPTSGLLLLLSCIVVLTPAAQNFTSGSDGSLGPLNITADTTLDVPANGIFNYSTVTVAANRTLKFRRNAANTPVYLLATGNISIAGTIDISGAQGNNVSGGLGGPGGFDGGSPGSVGVPPGAGQGPGAGRPGVQGNGADSAGGGSFSVVSTTGSSTNKGSTYGNALLIPIIGGSGGGGTVGTPGGGGGGGGGAILIASSTRIDLPGRILAYGGERTGISLNSGSAGAVRLVAPVVAGNGTIDVRGGNGSGHGRIRVDAADRSTMSIGFFEASVTSVGSMLLVFPNPRPRLDIIEAAGTAVPEGSGPVSLQLPFGSSPNRTIRVQARDFNAEIPITVVLTPDHGTPITYLSKINNVGANNPATVTVDVVLPVNEQTTIHVFSK